MSSSQRWSPGLRGRVLVHGRLAIFSDSPSSADLIRIQPQPRRMTARILKLAEREVWFVERAAFLCFMDNFFPFSPPSPSLFFLPITDCPSLAWYYSWFWRRRLWRWRRWRRGRLATMSCSWFLFIYFLIIFFFVCVNCQELSANLEVAKVEIRRFSCFCDLKEQNGDKSWVNPARCASGSSLQNLIRTRFNALWTDTPRPAPYRAVILVRWVSPRGVQWVGGHFHGASVCVRLVQPICCCAI